MPTTRRKAAGTAGSRSKAKATANQAKLTFHGRVTKPGTAADTPDKKAAALKAEKLESPAPAAAEILVDEQPTTSADSSLLEDEEPVVVAVEAPVDPDVVLARGVDEEMIKSYWEEKEKVMGAPRAHMKEMDLHEKLLRQWDVDNRYGPCMGIDRTRRWKRANSLGLNPPIEVLAVLVQEAEKGSKVQKSYIDGLMVANLTE